ncbi:MAG: peptide-methionine (S)-S-oxide reductase MsrA [Acidobacteriota bacterium]|nr:peptide-methionine (S)-S-oxide reductase MsrA [Acidobacteriota bacterium]
MLKLESAVLGGGCFWCVEAALKQLEGVHSVVSGYMGGTVDSPSYQQVCTGTTGHVEVVCVEFDPAVLSYRELLEVYFTAHDPTTLNRQGNDIGTQYRSVIFAAEAQRKVAAEVIAELTAQHVFDSPIVTTIEPLKAFWTAEGYHQDYYAGNPNQPYCRLVVAEKVAKVRQKYADRMVSAR